MTQEHAGLTLEGCQAGATITIVPDRWPEFLDGMFVLVQATDVTLRGLRFTLPQVDFTNAGGYIAGHLPGSIDLPETWDSSLVAVGVRVVCCSMLRVHNCRFESTELVGSDGSIPRFVAGIFATGVCSGLDIRGSWFSNSDPGGNSIQQSYGFFIAPSTTFSVNGANEVVRGTTVRPELEDAIFRDNHFQNLTTAVFVSAETGLVRFEGNEVRDCHAGLSVVSVDALTKADSDLQGEFQANPILLTQVLAGRVVAARNSMVKNAGNAFGRAYPLPPLPSGLANTLIRTFDVPPTPLTDLVSAIVLVERNLIDRGVVPAAIPLAFHALNNDIDVRRSTVDEVTGAAVAVFDTALLDVEGRAGR